MPTLVKFLGKINIGGRAPRSSLLALDEALASHTSFRIGGPAELLVRPRGEEDAAALVRAAREEGMEPFFLGGGANILVGDRGIRGLVLDLGGLDGLSFEEGPGGVTRVRAGAGLSMARLCELLLARGLGGFADFYGMPGELGGSLFMNARCYEAEMSELVSEIRYLDATGGLAILGKEEGDWGYKRSPFQAGGRASGGLILGASFELAPADRPSLASRMAERRRDREAKGHYRLPSAGSVFKNDRAFGRPTGKILDELGLRGKRIGDALVSPWHANIFVNAGRARASDMRRLIDLARDEARRGFGFELEPEVVFVGDF